MENLTYNERIKLATLILLEIERLVDKAILQLES